MARDADKRVLYFVLCGGLLSQKQMNIDMELIKVMEKWPDFDKFDAINTEAFPDDERLPSAEFLDIVSRFGCRTYAACDKGETVGFAAIAHDDELKLAFLWFLAVDSERRGSGYGSKILDLLKAKFPDCQLVLDMEQVADTSAGNPEQRRRRLKFYERNGFHRTMVGISYFGMNLEIMVTDPPFRMEDFEAMLRKLLASDFKPVMYPL